MKSFGTKLYYCLITGNVIKIILDHMGNAIETTFDEDYEIYTELKERDKSTIGLLEFEFGEYPKLSENSTGVAVNLETKELIFSYDELPIPPQEPTEIEIIQNKISILEASQDQQDLLLVELDMMLMASNVQTLNLATPKASSTRYDLLFRMIENKNYSSVEEMTSILETYKIANRITEEEFNILIEKLNTK